MWLRRAYDTGFCVTFARAVGERELLARMGVEPRRIRRLDEVDAAEMDLSPDHGFGPMVRTGRSGAWTFAIETGGGAEGVRPVVVRRAAATGEAVALSVNVNALAQLVVADHGRIVTELDPYRPEERSGAEPDRLLPFLRAVGLGQGEEPSNPPAAMLALAETAFNLTLDGAALTGPLPGGPITPLLDELEAPTGSSWVPDPVEALPEDPEFARRLAAATEDRLRPALADQTARLAADVGLSRRRAVVHVLTAIRSGEMLPTDNDSEFGWLLRRLSADARSVRLAGYTPHDQERQLVDGRVRAAYALLTAVSSPAWYGLVRVMRESATPAVYLASLRAAAEEALSGA